MKQGILKWIGAGIFALAMPLFVSADPGNKTETILVAADANFVIGIQDNKDKKKNDKDVKKTEEVADKKQDAPNTSSVKPEVKEVPKARPKLRPAAVADKIKVKKLPVKIKPKLIRSVGL